MHLAKHFQFCEQSIQDLSDYGYKYDYKSVMQYEDDAFSKKHGLKTMKAKVNILKSNVYL